MWASCTTLGWGLTPPLFKLRMLGETVKLSRTQPQKSSLSADFSGLSFSRNAIRFSRSLAKTGFTPARKSRAEREPAVAIKKLRLSIIKLKVKKGFFKSNFL